jgi:hypothetical protein
MYNFSIYFKWFGMENNLDNFIGKKVKIVLKDSYLKFGIFRGYNPNFIFLEYDSSQNSSIAIDQIKEITILKELKE